uniref:Uncharacterized protein n=1 Tax=Acrobeloides nanus TaxID=290746 RepID=A0A914E7S9_9BILA
MPEFPGRYMHEALLMEDEKILLIGGGDSEWSAPLDKIDAYDIKSNTFVKIETIPDRNHGFPIPRQFQTCVRDDEKIYVLGGRAMDKSTPNSSSNKDENAVVFDDIWQLKRIQIGNHFYYKWTQTVSNLKMPIFFHSSAITPDGCIYTFGGCRKPIYPSNRLQRVWIQPPTLKLMAMFRVLANYPPIINEIPTLEEQARMEKIEKELVVSNPIRLLKAWRQKCQLPK